MENNTKATQRTRCEELVTTRDPGRLPPNLDTEPCKFAATGQSQGKAKCGRHIKRDQDALTRGLVQYRNRIRQDHNSGRHEGQAALWTKCDFCHPEVS